MLSIKLFYVACKLFAALTFSDYPPDSNPTWVCRMSQSPAGFDFVLDVPKSGDLMVEHEDDCELAIQMASAGDI